mgnify:CR=1 FL=1
MSKQKLRVLIRSLWKALGEQQEWLEAITLTEEGDVAILRTRPGYIFDDAFWGVFQGVHATVCHVAYYGPERAEDGDRFRDSGIFELRFSLCPVLYIAVLEDKLEAMERIKTEATAVGAYFRYGPLLDDLAAAQEEQEDA